MQAIADKHGLQLFEDAAQAHGGSLGRKPVGAFGSFAMFSLYPTKNMTSGEGGMVSVATPEIGRLMRLYRNQGMKAQYMNEVVGFNARMSDIHAAIGRVQLTKVDGWTKQRQENAAFLSANLQGVTPPPVADGAVHVYHQYRIRVPADRDGLAKALRQEYNIGSGMFYPIPNHELAPFRVDIDLLQTANAAAECLSLLGPPVAEPGRPRAHRHRGQHPRQGRGLTMANLRAGLIGLGMMGRHHARVLANLEGVDLVGVADAGGDPHDVAGGRPLLPDIDELIALELDYCVVAVPTIYHEQIALVLAAAGIHALIQKPVTHDTPSARKVADAFAAQGLIGGVGHIERYNPALQSARVRLEAGELGTIYQVTTRRQGPFPARIADVGVIKDLASYDIDLTAWVTQQRFTSVAARCACRSGRDYEDLVAMTGQLGDGTVTNHLVNWLSPLKERVT